jgi:hypothetical protein
MHINTEFLLEYSKITKSIVLMTSIIISFMKKIIVDINTRVYNIITFLLCLGLY